VIGGGMPVGAYGGRREIMSLIAPIGPVYQAGTLSGNPLAMIAGITTLQLLSADGVWQQLENSSQQLASGIELAAKQSGIPIWQNRVGAMFATFFTDQPVRDLTSAKRSDLQAFKKFFHGMLEKGVYFAPSQFEAGFLSTAHTESEIEFTIEAAQAVFRSL